MPVCFLLYSAKYPSKTFGNDITHLTIIKYLPRIYVPLKHSTNFRQIDIVNLKSVRVMNDTKCNS